MDQRFNGRPHTHDYIGSKNGLDVQGKKIQSWVVGKEESLCQRRLLRHEVKPIESLSFQLAGQQLHWVFRILVALSLSQGELLSTKAIFWADIFQ